MIFICNSEVMTSSKINLVIWRTIWRKLMMAPISSISMTVHKQAYFGQFEIK